MIARTADEALTEAVNDVLAPAQRGDPVATAELLRLLRPLILRYCRARLGSSEVRSLTADDVAQEACIGVLCALPRYRREGRPFLAFVYGICANKVADAWRRMSREPVTFTTEAALDRPDLAADSDPERSTLTAAATTEISALLATLPDRDRDILIMRVVQGMSALDTGRVLDMTTGAVRVAQHRALAKMRRILPAETMARRPCHAGRSGRADTHRTRTMRTDTAYTVGRGGTDP